jgi:O-succinylbenzoate synthase
MRIEAITLREINMPLIHFFETSLGRTIGRRILLVTLHSEGLDAWSECVAEEHPFYSEESVDTAWYAITSYLAPALLGRNIEHGVDVPALFARVTGHRMAKAALENAVWEAEAQSLKIPLWKLLRGTQKKVVCGVSIGIQDNVEQLEEKVATELAAGYHRIKLKVKPGWDVDVLHRIRSRWPDILLSCDANAAYTMNDVAHVKEFERFKLLMIEQPLWNDDFYFHAKLQREIDTAICLDESIRNGRDARAALELGSCRIINIKVGRVGGFSEAIEIHDVAQVAGVPVWCGGMLEAGIGRAQNIALSTLPNFRLPGDVSASKRYWKEDIVDPEITVSKDGYIQVSDQPGNGYSAREDLIEKLTVRKRTLKAGGQPTSW